MNQIINSKSRYLLTSTEYGAINDDLIRRYLTGDYSAINQDLRDKRAFADPIQDAFVQLYNQQQQSNPESRNSGTYYRGCIYSPSALSEIRSLKAGDKVQQHILGASFTSTSDEKRYDAVILAVSHKEFEHIDFEKLSSNSTVIYDTKAFVKRNLVDGRL